MKKLILLVMIMMLVAGVLAQASGAAAKEIPICRTGVFVPICRVGTHCVPFLYPCPKFKPVRF